MTRRSPETIAAIEARLLAAALALGDDLDATSMPQLAGAASIAVGTLYRIAPSKAALGVRLEAIARAKFDSALFAPIPAKLALRARFGLIWQRLISFGAEKPQVARFLAARDLPQGCAFIRASEVFARDGAAAGIFAPLSGQQVAALVWGPVAMLMRAEACNLQTASALEECVWKALSSSGSRR